MTVSKTAFIVANLIAFAACSKQQLLGFLCRGPEKAAEPNQIFHLNSVLFLFEFDYISSVAVG